MKNKLLKKIIIGTGSVSIGAGIVLSAPGIINSSQNKTRTNKDYISDYFDFNQIVGREDLPQLNDILQDKDGNIWVGTRDNGLWKSSDGNTFTKITIDEENNELSIEDIFQDKDGNIWVGTVWQGLWKSTDGSTFTQITLGEGSNKWSTRDIFQDKDGNIWVGTHHNELWKSLDGNTFTQITLVDGEEENAWDIWYISQGKDGNIWVGRQGIPGIPGIPTSGLWKSSDGNTFTQVTLGEGSNQFIDNIFQDKDGNIWIGTRKHGLWKSSDSNTFTQVTPGEGSNAWNIWYISQGKDGNIWVGRQGIPGIPGIPTSGLWKSSDGNTFTKITIDNELSIEDIFQDKDGNIWVGTGQGLWKSSDNNIFTQVTLDEGSNKWNISDIFQDKDGNIWVGTMGHGLWKQTSEVIFTPGSTHNTIEEEGQTIYISDQSITVNIPPADQIIIDGEIISKTKEVTQYTFDSTESPHAITITIAGQHYVILVYIVESAEEINYVHYNSMPDSEGNTHLDIFLGIDVVTELSNNFLKGDSILNFFKWISDYQIWNGLFNKEDNLWDILLNNFENINDLENIDRNMIYPTPPTTSLSYDIFRTALVEKIDDLTNFNQTGLLVKLDLDQANIPINFGTDGTVETYWNNVLFS